MDIHRHDDDDDNDGKITITDDKIVVDNKNGDQDTVTHSEDKVAVAPLWAFDLHGGVTYTLTRWMHIGLDASVTAFYSSTGFSYRNHFSTVNPGVKLRLIFGNAV
jgi:hypothetical protein